MTFSYKEMFLLGWPILSVLLICSLVTLAVILERLSYFHRRKINVRRFFSELEALSGAKDPVRGMAASLGEPLTTLARTAFAAHSAPKEALENALDRAIRMQVAEMEQYVPLLGTVAGATPFIGLLGTVIGIIRAFKSIAVSGGGGPQTVAGGISEALVATALGLIVAIPALVFYNYFSTRIRRLTEEMEICADGLVELLARRRG